MGPMAGTDGQTHPKCIADTGFGCSEPSERGVESVCCLKPTQDPLPNFSSHTYFSLVGSMKLAHLERKDMESHAIGWNGLPDSISTYGKALFYLLKAPDYH